MAKTIKRFVVITGRPGIGKTTVFSKVVNRLLNKGYSVVGFICPEVRSEGRRVGFKIRSIDGVVETWLAKIEDCRGPRIGKYRLCSEAVKVVHYVLEQSSNANVIAIDEIGPMELRMVEIRKAIEYLLGMNHPGILVAHYRLSDARIKPLLDRYGIWFTVTLENRDHIVDEIYGNLINILDKHVKKR